MKKLLIPWLVASSTAFAAAIDRPSDFAYGIPLVVDGKEALYEVALPASVYRGLARADRGDVRVFNGTGDAVPYAWRPRRTTGPEPVTPVTLTLFPLKAGTGIGVDGISIRVRREKDGRNSVDVISSPGRAETEKRTVGYFIDLTALEYPLRALELDWQELPDGYAGKLRVEASDDLGSWRTLVAAAPLVNLEVAGQRLQQRRIELPQQKVNYLRLSWAAQDTRRPAPPELTAARGEVVERAPEAAREWARAELNKVEKTGEYLFDLRGHHPADRARLHLPEVNTVARVELLTRSKADQPWRPVARGVAYRLRRGESEITSPELIFDATTDRHWLLRVDPRGGGIGSGAPRLEAGWIPHTLVFAARGEPPFQLAYGSHGAKPGGHAIETLIPGYTDKSGTRLRAAKAGAQQTVNVASAQVQAQQQLGGEARLREKVDWKRWSLWGALVLGVLVLAAMAWRLMRQLDAAKNAPGAKAKEK
jgi:hypothetical protein